MSSLDESRTVITTLYLIATTTSSLVLPFMGRLLDKVGPLKVMVGTSESQLQRAFRAMQATLRRTGRPSTVPW